MITYPTKVEVDGVVIPIDTSFKTGLRCMEVIENDGISDQERALAIIFLLTDDIPNVNLTKLLQVLSKYLQCGQDKVERHSTVKDMNLEQDYKYIIASFMHDYRIDLSKEDMHWWRFMELLNGLSGECILNRVRDIRTMDLSIYKDAKTRERILKARKQVALKIKHTETEEEKEHREKFEAHFGTPSKSNQLDDDDYLLEDEE